MDMAFMTTGRATYQVEAVDQVLANYVGCPTATHRLLGRNATTYGFFVGTGRPPGNEVKVPGWPSRKGIRALFVPAVIDDGPNGSMPFDGWLAL